MVEIMLIVSRCGLLWFSYFKYLLMTKSSNGNCMRLIYDITCPHYRECLYKHDIPEPHEMQEDIMMGWQPRA